jgi:uncharacterized protein (TIGR03435 family)
VKNRLALGLLLFAARFISGQEPTLESTFDVASVKVATPGGGGDTAIHIEDGRVYCKCLLNQMIQEAYNVKLWRIAGPAWVLDPSTAMADGPFIYALDARFSGKRDVPQMMRNMLADRFHLVVHHESRIEAAYVLTVAPGGLKIKPSPPAPPVDASFPLEIKHLVGSDRATGDIHFHGAMSLSYFAFTLSSVMDLEVIDKTAQTGDFFVLLDANIPSSRAPLGGSILRTRDLNAVAREGGIFNEIQKLGLRLRPGREPIDHLVIDSVERNPTSN